MKKAPFSLIFIAFLSCFNFNLKAKESGVISPDAFKSIDNNLKGPCFDVLVSSENIKTEKLKDLISNLRKALDAYEAEYLSQSSTPAASPAVTAPEVAPAQPASIVTPSTPTTPTPETITPALAQPQPAPAPVQTIPAVPTPEIKPEPVVPPAPAPAPTPTPSTEPTQATPSTSTPENINNMLAPTPGQAPVTGPEPMPAGMPSI